MPELLAKSTLRISISYGEDPDSEPIPLSGHSLAREHPGIRATAPAE
jgi:hypothetical protein